MANRQRLVEEGRTVRGYAVGRVVGAGGYGEVYEAVAPAGDRVAFKVVPLRSTADRRAAKRFVLEAKVLSSIRHPNVVAAHDWGFSEDDTFLWMAMELLEGENLSQTLTRDPQLDVPVVLKLGQQICAGLGAAHAVGAVHRDVKPANIFIQADWEVKLVDFGVAKQRDVKMGTTVAVGTPLYMCPDYLRKGPRGDGDPRWDLYAVGMVLYQCIRGIHPFLTGSDPYLSVGAIVTKHLMEPIPPLSEVAPHCPPRVSACLAKALAKKCDDGWQSATELAAELAGCLRELSQSSDLDHHFERVSRLEADPPTPDPPVMSPPRPPLESMGGGTDPMEPDTTRAADESPHPEESAASPSDQGGTAPLEDADYPAFQYAAAADTAMVDPEAAVAEYARERAGGKRAGGASAGSVAKGADDRALETSADALAAEAERLREERARIDRDREQLELQRRELARERETPRELAKEPPESLLGAAKWLGLGAILALVAALLYLLVERMG